ncbi:MAG: DUF1624 domain-containing protein [Candidatus Eisenbacteria sp.]|nr:DUF1624 domain-containing protein [Candidatus Eisenbacteria bacterium]
MSQKPRYLFIDQLRGLIMALMGLDHASNYFNAVWKRVSYDNFLFDSAGQFIIRYLSYLCAPVFLMLAGAMVWLSMTRRIEKGRSPGRVRFSFIQRGFFLILVQLVWVNASWSGLARIRLDHFGIIAAIGSAIILLALVVRWRWWLRLALALLIILIHPLLLRIPYNTEELNLGMRVMQLFIDSGKWNLYPVLPWFALALFGSVAGEAWFRYWRDEGMRIRGSLVIGFAGVALFFLTRIPAGYGNILPFDAIGSVSFFFVQKYPTSLPHNFLFPGLVMICAALLMIIGSRLRWLLHPLEVYGRTPFFFYVVHIPLLAIVTRRIALLPYREGEVGAALLAWVGLLIVMYPICRWFAGVKARSSNPLIRMM